MIKHKAILTFLLSGALATNCYAQDVFTYDNEGELLGAAVNSVLTKGELIHGTLAYCAGDDKQFSDRATSVTNRWTERNAKYLSLGPVLLQEMRAGAIREGAQAEWKEFEGKTLPAQKEYVRNLLIGQLKILPAPQRKTMCSNVADAIDAGKFDFVAESQLIGYLDKRLAQIAKSKSN